MVLTRRLPDVILKPVSSVELQTCSINNRDLRRKMGSVNEGSPFSMLNLRQKT